ncbi:MAG: hypothetical protein [Circular genetic element sp.]|nr:MAG: hypothetical protein [Circular genetic element sp.]
MSDILVNGDVLQVTVATACVDQVGLNVFHYAVDSVVGGAATSQEAAIAIDAALAPLYKPLLGPDATYYGVQVRILFRDPTPTPSAVSASAGVGTAAAGAMPGQVAGVLTKRTAFVGRSYRGRTFLPFLSATMNDATTNSPTAAAIVLMEALAAELDDVQTATAGASTARLYPVLLHSSGSLYSEIQDIVARPYWGTMKSRGNLGRPNVFPPF